MLLGRSAQAARSVVSGPYSASLPSLRQPYGRLPRSLLLSCQGRSTHSQSESSSQSNQHRERLAVVCLIILGSSTFLFGQRELHLDAPQIVEEQAGTYRLDPSTSQPFPTVLPTPVTPLPSSCKELTLVGLGVRTVSFLRVRVYVAGLYIDSAALARLNKVEGWTGFQKEWMTDSKKQRSGEELLATLLDQGIAFAIRIVPVRPTDYGHLRDGFTRAVQGRAKLARKQQLLNESSDEALSLSLQALKDAFPRTSLPKGKALDLIFTPSSSGPGLDLTLEEDGKVLGKVESPRGIEESRFSVGRQLFLAYFADRDEISKPVSRFKVESGINLLKSASFAFFKFKESVAQGFQHAIQGSN